jgi:hypothetical protein
MLRHRELATLLLPTLLLLFLFLTNLEAETSNQRFIGTWSETMIFDKSKELPWASTVGKIEIFKDGTVGLKNIKLSPTELLNTAEGKWEAKKLDFDLLDKVEITIELEDNPLRLQKLELKSMDTRPNLLRLTAINAEGKSVSTDTYFTKVGLHTNIHIKGFEIKNVSRETNRFKNLTSHISPLGQFTLLIIIIGITIDIVMSNLRLIKLHQEKPLITIGSSETGAGGEAKSNGNNIKSGAAQNTQTNIVRSLQTHPTLPDHSKSLMPFLILSLYTIAWGIVFYLMVSTPILSNLQNEDLSLGISILLIPIILTWLLGIKNYSQNISISSSRIDIWGFPKREIHILRDNLQDVSIAPVGFPMRPVRGIKLTYKTQNNETKNEHLPLVGFTNPSSIVNELSLIASSNNTTKLN